MKLKLLFLTFLLLLVSQLILGQTKNEVEQRFKRGELPKITQNIVDILPDNCKRIKFYKETDGDKKSFEIKFKYKKQYYSIEFSEDGQLEDIEVVIKFKDIKAYTKKQIGNYFKQSYTKHKFIKIQRQYIYNYEIDASQFVINVLSKNTKTTTNFEIIAEVKSKKQRHLEEFIFNNDGLFLNSRILNPESYEHVLY